MKRFLLASVILLSYRQGMTRLLEQAIDEAARMPDKDQDAVASILLMELASQRRWSAAFGASQQQLAALGDEALREFQTGQSLPMDLSRDFPHD